MKQRIADEFITITESQALDDITAKELSQKLGVSRQTFYYYFHAIYEIME